MGAGARIGERLRSFGMAVSRRSSNEMTTVRTRNLPVVGRYTLDIDPNRVTRRHPAIDMPGKHASRVAVGGAGHGVHCRPNQWPARRK